MFYATFGVELQACKTPTKEVEQEFGSGLELMPKTLNPCMSPIFVNEAMSLLSKTVWFV